MSSPKNTMDGHFNGVEDAGLNQHHNGKNDSNGKGKPIPNHGTSSTATSVDYHPHSPTTEANMKKFMKNSRRSRSRFGRGLAKKGKYILVTIITVIYSYFGLIGCHCFYFIFFWKLLHINF